MATKQSVAENMQSRMEWLNKRLIAVCREVCGLMRFNRTEVQDGGCQAFAAAPPQALERRLSNQTFVSGVRLPLLH